MSNLREFLIKRRSKFYGGGDLQYHIDSFLHMVDRGSIVHEFPDAVIVLEKSPVEGDFRGWLLFGKFTRGTVRAMQKVTDEFNGKRLFAETHDVRIRNLLVKIGYEQYHADSHDYYLIKRSVQ